MARKQRINDLEILLSIKREGENFVKETKDDLTDVDKLLKRAKVAGLAFAGVVGAAFLDAIDNGRDLAIELNRMGKLLGTGTGEAEALFRAFREQNPAADIDALSDGLLTLQERFSEARVDTGELFNFAKDFGLTINENVSGATEQTIEFLNILKQLPSEGDRVTTAIAVMGDEGARQFNAIIRDTEKIDDLLVSLQDGVDGVFNDQRVKDIDNYIASQQRLDNAWDDLSLTLFGIVDGPLAGMNLGLAATIESINTLASSGVQQLQNYGKAYVRYITAGLVDVDQIQTNRTLNNFDRSNSNRPDRVQITAEDRARADQLARQHADLRIKAEMEEVKRQQRETAEFKKKIDREEAERIERENEILIAREDRREAEFFARKLRKQQGLANVDVGRNLNQNSVDLTPDELLAIDQKLKDLTTYTLSEQIQDTILLAGAFGQLGGAISNFSDTFFTKGSRAFNAFKSLQIAAATAAAYSAAAQQLADFSSLTFVEKVGRAAAILGIGLNYAAQIKKLSASGGGGGGATASPQPTIPTAPQQFNTQIDDAPQQVVNITIPGRTDNTSIDADDLEDALEILSDRPGSPIYRLNQSVI